MLHEIIYLNQHYKLDNNPWIEICVPYNNDEVKRVPSKAIVIVPGGAYCFVSIREADPVAINYMNEGFVTITLNYTINKKYPIPMQELGCAIDYIRNNCDKYFIDKDKISVIGFSAGGHLVSSFGYLCENEKFLNETNLVSKNIKPNCIISSYPVITMGEYTHLLSKQIITGEDEELIKLLSVENHITSSYPPTFVWTTKEDSGVPYENTLLFIDSLKKANVIHDYFIYQYLDHGLSIISPLLYSKDVLQDIKMKEVSMWFNKSIDFINKIFK